MLYAYALIAPFLATGRAGVSIQRAVFTFVFQVHQTVSQQYDTLF